SGKNILTKTLTDAERKILQNRITNLKRQIPQNQKSARISIQKLKREINENAVKILKENGINASTTGNGARILPEGKHPLNKAAKNLGENYKIDLVYEPESNATKALEPGQPAWFDDMKEGQRFDTNDFRIYVTDD